VIGVVSGSHPHRPEPEEGSLIPDYVFGLAQYYSTLCNLRGAALEDKRLVEHMDVLGFVAENA